MKPQTIFVCSQCDAQFPKWAGRCLSCGAWNTLIQQAAGLTFGPGGPAKASAIKAETLAAVASPTGRRYETGISELDQIFGGQASSGIVPGSLVLLGGDPGIGKSTLTLQLALGLSGRGIKTLYVSGEESLPQLKLRAERLSSDFSGMLAVSENNLDAVLATAEAEKPKFLVIDSIQTMFSESASGVAGGVAQVSAATMRLMEFAKERDIATLIIGHVTKEGNLAGPRLLEHMVDVVLYLEGDRFLAYRLLRCVKNRFGRTDEVGVFEMKNQGLVAVENPSRAFLAERVMRQPGAVVTCTMEGSRPLLLEIQALTSKSQFNYPKRTATGYDLNRLLLLSAVLQKRLSAKIYDQDIFVSVAGGFKINETACDLAVAFAILSSLKDFVVPADLIAVGEVGLTGELRMVGNLERRITEAAKLGFKKMIIPAASATAASKLKLLPAHDLSEALKLIG
ncbi:MAG: DNA repair protein RadA [Patescibacteria group bacterium]|nr:DNA repair protein RadA [Patescibacteria group bacterium]